MRENPRRGAGMRGILIVVLGLLVAVAVGQELRDLAHDGAVGTAFGALAGLAAGLGVFMSLGGDA